MALMPMAHVPPQLQPLALFPLFPPRASIADLERLRTEAAIPRRRPLRPLRRPPPTTADLERLRMEVAIPRRRPLRPLHRPPPTTVDLERLRMEAAMPRRRPLRPLHRPPPTTVDSARLRMEAAMPRHPPPPVQARPLHLFLTIAVSALLWMEIAIPYQQAAAHQLPQPRIDPARRRAQLVAQQQSQPAKVSAPAALPLPSPTIAAMVLL